jgi:hypothetical protein
MVGYAIVLMYMAVLANTYGVNYNVPSQLRNPVTSRYKPTIKPYTDPMCTCHWQSLGSELLHTTSDDEMMRKMSWIQIELNWIQIQLRNEIQTGAQDIEICIPLDHSWLCCWKKKQLPQTQIWKDTFPFCMLVIEKPCHRIFGSRV